MSDRRQLLCAAVLVSLVPLTACSIDVQEESRDVNKKSVDIRTPVYGRTVWGSDLSTEYVIENSSYTS